MQLSARLRAAGVRTVRRILAARDCALVKRVEVGRPPLIDVFEKEETNDFVRLSTLELCAHEIIREGVPGSIAEVGVYRGIFAGKVNALFPSRTFYLFDTFTGFNETQIRADAANHGLKHYRDFSGTSEEYVLSRMPHPGVCVIRKGLFPATAAGIDDQFCFVSLDPDLFQPTYDGLRFFWPRMNAGGFIFVHDYNNARFPGVKAAVLKFAAECETEFVPLCDTYGTAIFRKRRT